MKSLFCVTVGRRDAHENKLNKVHTHAKQNSACKRSGRTRTTTLLNHFLTLLTGEASSEFTMRHIITNMAHTGELIL